MHVRRLGQGAFAAWFALSLPALATVVVIIEQLLGGDVTKL